MSFIAGYYLKSTENKSEKITSAAYRFNPEHNLALNNDLYDIGIETAKGGCIISKSKKDAPKQIRLFNSDRRYACSLGFNKFKGDNEFCDYNKLKLVDPVTQFSQSEGEFVAAVLDKDSGHIDIINDRFSSRPCYLYKNNDGVFFSSNLAFLLEMIGYMPEIDYEGLIQFFTLGYTLAERTNHKGIQRLKPACSVHIDNHGIKIDQYRKIRVESNYGISKEEMADAAFAAMQKSASQRSKLFPGSFLALSGGLDSRMVAAALPRNANYHTYTWVSSTAGDRSPDAVVAAQISERLGFTHHIERINAMPLSDCVDEIVKLTGGLMQVNHTLRSYQYVMKMRQLGGVCLGGGSGDAFAGVNVSSLYQLNKFWRARSLDSFAKGYHKQNADSLKLVLRKDIVEQFYTHVKDNIINILNNFDGQLGAHRIVAWNSAIFEACFTSTSPVHNHPDVTEARPHLGYDYTDLMLSLPVNWFYNKNFYRYMIYKNIPEIRDIVYANTGELMTGDMVNVNASLPRLICRMLKNKTCKCFGVTKPQNQESVYFRNIADRDRLLIQQDKKLIDSLKEKITYCPSLKNVFDTKKACEYIDNFVDGKIMADVQNGDTNLMSALITTAYWFSREIK